MRLVFVGAGRLATQLAQALRSKGHETVAVFSRTMESAEALCAIVGGRATDSLSQLPLRADAFILAVKDAVLPEIAAQLAGGREDIPMFHTAGSMPMSVLSALPHHGVIYPMQTFSKERKVDFTRVPIFIEGSSERAWQVAEELASAVSNDVRRLASAVSAAMTMITTAVVLTRTVVMSSAARRRTAVLTLPTAVTTVSTTTTTRTITDTTALLLRVLTTRCITTATARV